jgi:hypothetical protein
MNLDEDDLMLIAFLIARARKDNFFTKVLMRLDSLHHRIHLGCPRKSSRFGGCAHRH